MSPRSSIGSPWCTRIGHRVDPVVDDLLRIAERVVGARSGALPCTGTSTCAESLCGCEALNNIATRPPMPTPNNAALVDPDRIQHGDGILHPNPPTSALHRRPGLADADTDRIEADQSAERRQATIETIPVRLIVSIDPHVRAAGEPEQIDRTVAPNTFFIRHMAVIGLGVSVPGPARPASLRVLGVEQLENASDTRAHTLWCPESTAHVDFGYKTHRHGLSRARAADRRGARRRTAGQSSCSRRRRVPRLRRARSAFHPVRRPGTGNPRMSCGPRRHARRLQGRGARWRVRSQSKAHDRRGLDAVEQRDGLQRHLAMPALRDAVQREAWVSTSRRTAASVVTNLPPEFPCSQHVLRVGPTARMIFSTSLTVKPTAALRPLAGVWTRGPFHFRLHRGREHLTFPDRDRLHGCLALWSDCCGHRDHQPHFALWRIGSCRSCRHRASIATPAGGSHRPIGSCPAGARRGACASTNTSSDPSRR